jgi:hypothetical protein
MRKRLARILAFATGLVLLTLLVIFAVLQNRPWQE